MAETQESVSDTKIANQPEDLNQDEKVSRRRRFVLFLSAHWRGVVCLITPLLFIAVLAPFPPEKYQWCAYTLLIMAVFWVTECIPLPVTSFLPIVIFPLADVMDTRTACLCYINDTIIMFYGSMALAYAVEQSGLHKRVALGAIRLIGYSHYRLLLAMSLTTMFISMWITNTAATTMMVPIIFAVLQVFEDLNLISTFEKNANGDLIASDITTCYFCAASFSATIGGIGTLVGSATNLVFKGLYERTYPSAPEYLSFPKYSAFSVPYMLILEAGLYFTLIVKFLGFLRPKSEIAKRTKIPELGKQAAKNVVEQSWKELGNITFWEIVRQLCQLMVIILFSSAMLLFFCRSPQIFQGWGDAISEYFNLNNYKYVRDSAAALLVVFLMLLLPSTLEFFKNFTAKTRITVSVDDLPKNRITSVLSWTLMDDIMPYSFMFLLGGGFALSEAAKKEYSDLNGQIGKLLKNLSIFPNHFIMLLIIIFTIFVTNFASNVAVCNVITPIVMQLAKEINIHPLWYNIVSGVSASFCFCIPVGTPGNLIIQSSANIPTITMVSVVLYNIKTGFWPSVATILITWFTMYYWAPVIWPDLISASPQDRYYMT
ncbi:hypothetical protein HW555_000707 [Spodoptera exigua]|uniref:Uncharacterized protein n=1 Tax=Spodoptera exigua TaxID=7107 RepID=A0A835GT81_SPOEX|nr:hypothetical protein HW555_000707 [Spodoptera exigua]